MAIGYSYDLKKRAVEAVVEKKKNKKRTAKTFGIAVTTLEKWMRDYNAGKDLHPKKNWQKGYGQKIKDLDAFKKFVDENRDLTLVLLAKKLGKVDRMTVSRAMVKIGYTKKKDLWVCGKK